jgi:hypothetical protein
MSSETVIALIIAAIGSPLCLRFFEWLVTKNEIKTFKLLALKCTITNKELSKQARLDAYDAYKKLGGNSWIDDYVNKNIRTIEDTAA